MMAGETANPGSRSMASRLRRLLLLFVLGIVLLLALAGGGLWWLLGSGGGRDFLMAQIVVRLPPGALTWEKAEGPLAGPLTLYGLRYRQQTEDGELVFTARRVHIDPELRPLLGRKLRLDALEVDDAALLLPPSKDEPFEVPRWPDVLPKIEVPLALSADAVRVRGLRVRQGPEPVIAIRSLTAGLDAENGSVRLRDLALDSDRAVVALDGEYASIDNFRTRLDGRITLPAPPGQSPARFDLRAGGDLDTFDLTLDGQAPGPVSLKLGLKDGASATPAWTLTLRAPRLDPALLTAGGAAPAAAAADDAAQDEAGPADTALAIALDASGRGGSADLRGRFGQGDLDIVVAPSKLGFADGVLDLRPLVVQAYEGEAKLTGRVDLKPESPTLDAKLVLAGFRFEAAAGDAAAEGERVALETGEFTVKGTVDAWHIDGGATLLRNDSERAELVVTGDGEREHIVLERLAANTASGALDGKGMLRWAPRLAWELDAALRDFDPGYFAPEYPGAISGRLSTRGEQREDGGYQLTADLPDLRGTLRKRTLAGRAKLDWRGDRGEADVDLKLGDSRVQAAGAVGERLDIDARLMPLQLADLLPDAGGTLQGRVSLRGARAQPDVRADLTGAALHWGEYAAAELKLKLATHGPLDAPSIDEADLAATALRIGDYSAESLTVKGKLPWQGRGGALALQARELEAGIAFDTASVDVTGSATTPALRATLRGEQLALDLSGSTTRNARGLSGRIDTLRIAPSTGAAWSLQQPATFAQSGDRFRLDPSCFTPEEASGSLCAEADWPRSARANGRDLPLALLDPWLASDEGRSPRAYGTLQFEADVAPRGTGYVGKASLRANDGGIRLRPRARRSVFAYDTLNLDVDLEGDTLDATLAARMPNDGRIDGRLRTGFDENSALDGSVDLAISDLTFITLLSPDVLSPTGRISGRVGVGGTRAQPRLEGRAELTDFRAELAGLGITLTDGRVALDALPSGDGRIEGRVVSGEGDLNVAGTLRLDDPARALALTVKGENFTAANTPEFNARVSPDLSIGLDEGVLNLRGEILVPYARIGLADLEGSVTASPDVVVTDPIDPPAGPPTRTDLDFTVAMGEDVRLNGFGFDGKLDGRLRVRQRPGREMVGSGRLDVTGRYQAYGQKLEITRARLGWANSPLDDPSLDVIAQREFESATVGLKVRGTTLQPVTEVFSDPPMPQSQALQMLVLGGSELTVGKALSPRLYVSFGVSMLDGSQVLTMKYLLGRGFDVQIESGLENRGSVNWRRER